MPFSMEYLQHVLHKNVSRHCKEKGLEWNLDSPSMALSPSSRVQGHRVKFLPSPIDPLSMESRHLFAVFIWAKTTEMQVRERTIVQNIKKWQKLTKAFVTDYEQS
jgi:hypothetical protein